MITFLALFPSPESRNVAKTKAQEAGVHLVMVGVGYSITPPVGTELNFIILRGSPMDGIKMMQFGASSCGQL